MNLYHYTSLEAVAKIVNVRGLTFLGTRYDSMNDPNDFTFSKEKVLPALMKSIENDDSLSEHAKDFTQHYPYIVSLSECGDNEMMLERYGKIAIILDQNCIRRHLLNEMYFEKCRYVSEDDDINDHFVEVFNGLHDAEEVITSQAMAAFAILKEKEWSYENEWRLYAFDYDGFDAVYNPLVKEKCEVYDCEQPRNLILKCIRPVTRINENDNLNEPDLIITKEFCLPKCALAGFVIATPNDEYFYRLKSHLLLWLHNIGYETRRLQITQLKNKRQ